MVINFTGSTHDLIVSQGYRLTDDSWGEQGRRTYIHDDDAERSHITRLSIALRAAGWKNDSEKLRSFVHPGSKEIIEIEPGGSETSGHFLHHMKPV
jgi:hypothetical protein